MQRLTMCVVVCVLATLTGCSSGPRTYPVSGRVVFPDKSPVTSGVIEFAPLGGGPAARGQIGNDGHFTLKTESRTGAIAGEHQIVVIQTFLADGLADHVRKGHAVRMVDGRYRKFETSGLRRTVEAGANDFVIEVQQAAKKEKDAGWGK